MLKVQNKFIGEKMITSVSNKKIKDIQKLKENKNIKKYGKYLIEGKHLVEEQT